MHFLPFNMSASSSQTALHRVRQTVGGSCKSLPPRQESIASIASSHPLQKEAHYGSDDGRCCRVHRDKGQRVQDMADEGFCNGEGDNFRAPQFDSKGNLIRQLTEEGEYVDATLQRNPIAERVLRDGFCDDREFAEEDEYEDESISVQPSFCGHEGRTSGSRGSDVARRFGRCFPVKVALCWSMACQKFRL